LLCYGGATAQISAYDFPKGRPGEPFYGKAFVRIESLILSRDKSVDKVLG
jgi:hypothetical protein